MGHGNIQVGSGQMFGSNSTHDPTTGYPNATHEHTYDQGWSGQLSYNANMEGFSGQLPTMRQEDSVNWCGARGGMALSAPDLGGAGGYEGGQAHAYPRTGYVPMGTPGGSDGQGRNEGGMAYGMQGNMQDGNNCSGNQQWYGNECQGYNIHGGQSQMGGGPEMGGGGSYRYGCGYGSNPGMMNGPYYGGGGYGGVQMAQPTSVGGYEGNYVNGGFDQGAAEARQAFPLGGFPPYQGESLRDAVDAAFGIQRGDEGRTSGQHSQTGRGAGSGQSSQDGGGRGEEREGGERKRQGTRAGGSGLYTAADHEARERRRGGGAQRGQSQLPERQSSQSRGGGANEEGGTFVTQAQREERERGRHVDNAQRSGMEPDACEMGRQGGANQGSPQLQQQGGTEDRGLPKGLPKGATVYLPNGMAVSIDDATVEMGALGENQITYMELTNRQKVVRDLSVKRKGEIERAGRSLAATGRHGPLRGKGGKGKGKVYEHPHAGRG